MTEQKLDRYEELESVRLLSPYKACYVITERDSKKGMRITKVDADSGGLVRESKWNPNLEGLCQR